MTPYELSVAIKIFQKRKQMEYDEQVSIAWLGEYFHRLKKLKKLEEYISKPKEKHIMTDDEMKEQVLKLNALFGGTVETEGSD